MRICFFVLSCTVLICAVGCVSKSESLVARAPADQPEAAGARALGKPWSYYAYGWMGDALKSLMPKKKSAPPLAIPVEAFGEVRQVNSEHSFVLLTCQNPAQAVAGGELYCTDGKHETATLRVAPLRNNYFLIADIVEGRPATGNRVFKR